MLIIEGMALFYMWTAGVSAAFIFLLGGFKESFWLGLTAVGAYMYLEHLA